MCLSVSVGALTMHACMHVCMCASMNVFDCVRESLFTTALLDSNRNRYRNRNRNEDVYISF